VLLAGVLIAELDSGKKTAGKTKQTDSEKMM
jgi:hypothetical protein